MNMQPQKGEKTKMNMQPPKKQKKTKMNMQP